MTKVKQDFLGLYVTAGGYISRPQKPTNFNVGDEVSTYHHGGSTVASVKDIDGQKQHWTTTGIGSDSYKIIKKKLSNQDFENVVIISLYHYLINNPLYPKLSHWHGKNYVDYRDQAVSDDLKWCKEIIKKTLTDYSQELENKKSKKTIKL